MRIWVIRESLLKIFFSVLKKIRKAQHLVMALAHLEFVLEMALFP
jgi:hypothetical protein